MAAPWFCPDASRALGLYVLLFYTILRYIKQSVLERPWARPHFDNVNAVNFARLTSTYVAVRLGKAVVSTVVTFLVASGASKKFEASPAYIFFTLWYYVLTELNNIVDIHEHKLTS